MKRYFFTILNLLLAFLILIVFVLPQYQNWRDLEAQVFQKKAEIKTRQDYFQSLKETKEELVKYQEQIGKMASAFPADPAIPSVLDFFQKIASQKNLILKRIELGQKDLAAENPYLAKQAVFLEIEGKYEDFKEFILSLEKSSRMISAESLAFSMPEKGTTFLFNLTVSVNFMPEVPAAEENR